MDFGEVATLQRGYDLPYRSRKPGSVPVVTSSGVGDTHFEARVSGPGVVTGRYGTIGEVFFIREDFWPLNTTLFVKDFHGNDPLFVSYLLRTIDFHSHSGKSGVPGVNRNDLHALTVRVPQSVDEQRSIAGTLGDVDALLGALTRLIAKKRDLKQAAMQQLLTGQIRLPGFRGEWEIKRLGEVSGVDSDNLPADTPSGYEFNYISLEDVDTGVLRAYSEQVFRSAPSRARRRLKDGDILVATVRPNLRSHLLFTRDEPHWICSTGFSVVRCTNGVAFPAYVFFHLFGNDVSKQIDTLLTGSNYPAINGGDVKALQIPMPSIEEQTAIAAVLSDMDAELVALEARLAKTRALKQGMMQELLTGRTRLV